MAFLGREFTKAPLVTSDLPDNAVTLAKMTGGTDGNIISYDASGDPVAIATGSDGQVLTSAGAGSPPAFEGFPAGHIVNIGFDDDLENSSITNDSFDWATYLVTLDMTSPTTGNILYAQANTGGHVAGNVSWCQTQIWIDHSSIDATAISQVHAAAYFNDNTSYPGGGGSVMGKYVIPSGSGTITVRLLAYVNNGNAWSVTGTSLICWEVQG